MVQNPATTYQGSRWFKCDLHLHTPASKCFLDKTITPESWVKAAVDAGLQCVAVTDHNTGDWIDKVKVAAENKLSVFPGVEITCDTSKIHLLVLFEMAYTTQKVEDFLIRCGISRENFSNSDAHSEKTIFEIARLANEEGALVIPAHIDEFNGLAYCASRDSLEKFVQLPYINAVQIVHQEFLNPDLKIKDNQEIVNQINAFYQHPVPPIGADSIKQAFDGLTIAKSHNLKFLTFSDNPDKEHPSKHGLSGIGKCYSWIKMDSNFSLESLRQSFIMPNRVINSFDSINAPYKSPSLWIRKLTIQNTALTRKNNVFEIEFNPQLSTIIGGRGSGKSSILRFLRGVFKKEKDLDGLADILEDHKEFFKKIDSSGRGVLKDDTRIEVYFERDGLDYRIVYLQSSPNDTIVERFNIETNLYENVDDYGFIDFFTFEQYSQKQIFSIAQQPNSLRNRIDGALLDVLKIHSNFKLMKDEYLSEKAKYRASSIVVNSKGRLNTEIKDLESKILLLKQTGISEIISKKQQYDAQKQVIEKYRDSILSAISLVKNIPKNIDEIQSLDLSQISETYRDEINQITKKPLEELINLKAFIEESISHVDGEIVNMNESLTQSKLFVDANEDNRLFEEKKVHLESQGITDMSSFELYSKSIAEKQEELLRVEQKTLELTAINDRIAGIKQQYGELRSTLSELRSKFVEHTINSDKIQVLIKPYSDDKDFVTQFRNIIQKSTSYDKGIDVAKKTIFESSELLKGLKEFKNKMHEIHDDSYTGDEYDGFFVRMVKDLSDAQLDMIDLLYPEDKVEVKYKGRDGNYKPISVASAGQKTTAILSFILSFGDMPLILDQPEDDLDNRLVYDLIVDKMRQIKEHRQVIVVTHNANIPVNADAEYVISMSSDSHNLKIQASGTVEDEKVKKEICEVMEGGVEAFKTRAKRYSL